MTELDKASLRLDEARRVHYKGAEKHLKVHTSTLTWVPLAVLRYHLLEVSPLRVEEARRLLNQGAEKHLKIPF